MSRRSTAFARAVQEVRAGERGDERIARAERRARPACPIWRSSPVDDHADAVGERGRVLEVVGDEQDRDARGRRAARCSSDRTSAFVWASSAESGSSSRSTSGSRASARASATRWRSPPERLAGPRVLEVRDAEAVEVLVGRVAARVLDVLADGQVREERVVLEDEADAAPVGRERDVPRAVEPDLARRRDAARRPAGRAPRSRAARSSCRRPDGPTSAIVEPTSRLSSEAEGPKRDGDLFEGELCHVESDSEAEEQDDADQDEHAAHRERRVEVAVELGVDRERERLRDPLQAAREHDRRAELAEPAREREREPCDQAAAREREHDAEERARRARAERARGGGQVRIGRLERGDRLADVERARDVGDRDGDGGSG